ncbi:MAG: hypothetical protein HFJ40_06110 [Clostridia bacterium]|nr:hypothetical protein [Clostridia bacterium]
MKTQKFDFENNEIVQIYINKTEQENSKIIEEISNIKSQYANISIFINGENDTVKTIKEILNYEKSKNMK